MVREYPSALVQLVRLVAPRRQRREAPCTLSAKATSVPLTHTSLSLSTTYYPAEPITLDFGWNEVGAVAIVGLTALVLDFMAFRASELEKRKSALQKQQQHHHHQQQPSLASSSDNVGTNDDANPTSPVPNGHGEAATSYDCTGEQGTKGADGGGGAVGGSKGSGVVEVEVRPAEEAAAAERRGRVQMRRVFVLAAWIACALGFHRCGRCDCVGS